MNEFKFKVVEEMKVSLITNSFILAINKTCVQSYHFTVFVLHKEIAIFNIANVLY